MRQRFPMQAGTWPWIGKAVFVGLSGWFWFWLAGPPDPKLNVYAQAGPITADSLKDYKMHYTWRKNLRSQSNNIDVILAEAQCDCNWASDIYVSYSLILNFPDDPGRYVSVLDTDFDDTLAYPKFQWTDPATLQVVVPNDYGIMRHLQYYRGVTIKLVFENDDPAARRASIEKHHPGQPVSQDDIDLYQLK